MARKTPSKLTGELVVLPHTSKVLASNPLGDPADRHLTVWLPPGYQHNRKALPVMFDLVGYTGSGYSHTNWNNFAENVPERLNRLVSQGDMAPAIVVFPDCFTALGGNQYVNSSAIGRYADYLTRELIPLVDGEFNTRPDRRNRACFGKSSGGYGAIIHGMKYARYWGAVGDHSGDAYFDFIYRSDWPGVLDTLARYKQPANREGAWRHKPDSALGRGLDDGRIARFLQDIWKREKLGGNDVMALMLVAMAATYDPDPKAPNGFRVPFHLDSGEIIERRWNAWLKHDPIHMVREHRDALKSLAGIWVDCGWRDQYHIHYGTRLLSRELGKHDIKHTYEEFDDTHSGVDYRMDRSLPFLAKAISKQR